MLRRVRPGFPPGSPEVRPRLTRFRGGRSAAGAASLYNLRLLPKASGKGTGAWPAPGFKGCRPLPPTPWNLGRLAEELLQVWVGRWATERGCLKPNMFEKKRLFGCFGKLFWEHFGLLFGWLEHFFWPKASQMKEIQPKITKKEHVTPLYQWKYDKNQSSLGPKITTQYNSPNSPWIVAGCCSCFSQPQRWKAMQPIPARRSRNAMAGGVPTHIPQNGSRGLTLLSESKKNWFKFVSETIQQIPETTLKPLTDPNTPNAPTDPCKAQPQRWNAMATDPCKAQPQRLNAMAGGVPTHIPQNGSRGLTLLSESKKNWFPKRSNRSLQGAASALKGNGNRSLQGAAAAPKRNGRRRSNAHSAERFEGANVAFWIQEKLVSETLQPIPARRSLSAERPWQPIPARRSRSA